MALRADSPYIAVPVFDPFLWQWCVWQHWLLHVAAALPGCVPCLCCGFPGAPPSQQWQPSAMASDSNPPCCAPGLAVELSLERCLAFAERSPPTSPKATTRRAGRRRKRLLQVQKACSRPKQNFDDELLDHAMQVFSSETGSDLQVDWNSSGLGFVCSAGQLRQQECPQTYGSGERVVLKGLNMARMNGEIGTVTALLATGAEVLSFDGIAGTSAVHRAAEHGRLAVLQALLLVEPGAKDAISEHGLTPLRLAALNGHRELVEFLLEAGVGADKDKSSAVGATALHLAALNGHVEAGAEVDRLTGGGKTPLHGAALYGHVTVVRILLDFGADREVATEAGPVGGEIGELQVMLSSY
eukprot:Skav205243  [mRNA]  locus=scaffold1794:381295:386470:- [translate_table: standard]